MKKTISLILVTLVLLSMLTLTACSSEKAVVESVLTLDSNYVGQRTITVKYPLDTHIDSLAKKLEAKNPLVDSEKSTFEYKGVGNDGYTFVMNIVFDSREDYISQMSQLVSRDVVSDMSQPESVLCSGTRMKEDFDVADIIRWMTDISENNEETEAVKYDYPVNTVSINGTVFNTDSTVDISQREGEGVDSISIETTNLKDGTFDRTVTFLVPNKTFTKLKGSIEPYFSSITPDSAQYSDWTNLGENWEYKVILKSLDIEKLSECTAMLLDTDKDTLFYGDRDNTSTPLTEGLVFEEEFNTFSFMNSKGDDVDLVYKYALPVKTTHGDGSVFVDSKWSAIGEWVDGVYSVNPDTDTFEIRVPDGIQYSINGIRMNLDVAGGNEFIRKTEFLYSKSNGMDGVLYARNFFENKGAVVETDEDDENLICRVVLSGDSQSVNDQLVKFFGSGNFMAYNVKDRALSLSDKTELTEYVNFSYMLNHKNAERPITYTVSSSCDEKLVNLSCDTSDTQKAKGDSKQLTVEVTSGEGTVVYKGKIADVGAIVVFCIVSAVVLALLVGITLLFLNKKKSNPADFNLKKFFTKKKEQKIEITDELSDKQLLDEINADIEKQIDAMGDDAEISELERIMNSDESFGE